MTMTQHTSAFVPGAAADDGGLAAGESVVAAESVAAAGASAVAENGNFAAEV